MTETTLLQGDQFELVEPGHEVSVTPQKPEGLPEKFWDPKAGVIRVDALLKSYLDLEKKLAAGQPDPLSEAGRRELCTLLGCPETPDAYQIDVSHGLFMADPELNARLHAHGFTGNQVQEVYNLAAERLVPLIRDMASEFQAERELERLVTEFGGAEKWTEMSRQLLNFGRTHVQPDVLQALASSFEGIMVLYKMMVGESRAAGLGAGEPARENGADSLQALMRDPKYWRDRDPAFIAKVTQGFEQVYKD